jgi:hypothetical protein
MATAGRNSFAVGARFGSTLWVDAPPRKRRTVKERGLLEPDISVAAGPRAHIIG